MDFSHFGEDAAVATGVVVAGAGGRMGVRVINQILGAEDLTLTGALEREGFPGLGGDAGQTRASRAAGAHR